MLSYGLDISFIHSYLIQKSCQNTCYFVNLIMFIIVFKTPIRLYKIQCPCRTRLVVASESYSCILSNYTFFLYAHLETVRIMWLGMAAGVHTGLRTITLVLYIGSLPNLATWFPRGRERTLIIFGVIRSKVKVTVAINRIFDNGRFRTITLVLYIDL